MNNQRLTQYGLTPAILGVLQAACPVLDRTLSRFGQCFFEALVLVSDLAPLQRRKSLLEEAEQRQCEHWRILFSGRMGAPYMASMARIAGLYKILGIQPSAYIAAYTSILDDVHGALRDHALSSLAGVDGRDLAAAMMEAVDRAVLMDVDLLSDVYAAGGDRVRQHSADSYISSIAGQMDKVCKQLHAEMTTIADQPVARPRVDAAYGTLGAIVERMASLANQANQIALATSIEATRVGGADLGRTIISREEQSAHLQPARQTGDIAQQIADVRAVLRDVEAAMSRHDVRGDIAALDALIETLATVSQDGPPNQAGGTVIVGRFCGQGRPSGLSGVETGQRHRAGGGVVTPFRLRRRIHP